MTTITTITASKDRIRLHRMIDEAAQSHQPLLISGKRNEAMLVCEQDWRPFRRPSSPCLCGGDLDC